MKTGLVVIMVAAFASYGSLAIAEGDWRSGTAAILLAVANGLLLL